MLDCIIASKFDLDKTIFPVGEMDHGIALQIRLAPVMIDGTVTECAIVLGTVK